MSIIFIYTALDILSNAISSLLRQYFFNKFVQTSMRKDINNFENKVENYCNDKCCLVVDGEFSYNITSCHFDYFHQIDDPLNNKLFCSMLSKKEIDSRSVTNGFDALTTVIRTPNYFNIIFIDNQMPHMVH